MFTNWGYLRLYRNLNELSDIEAIKQKHLEQFTKQANELTKLREWLKHDDLKHDIDFEWILIDNETWTQLLNKNKIAPEFILIDIVNSGNGNKIPYTGAEIFRDIRNTFIFADMDDDFLKRMVRAVFKKDELLFESKIDSICTSLSDQIGMINEHLTDIQYVKENECKPDINNRYDEPVQRVIRRFSYLVSERDFIHLEDNYRLTIQLIKQDDSRVMEIVDIEDTKEIQKHIRELSTILAEALHLKMCNFKGCFEYYFQNTELLECLPNIINQHGYLFYDELKYLDKQTKPIEYEYGWDYIIKCQKHQPKIKELTTNWQKQVQKELDVHLEPNLGNLVLSYLVA